MEFGTAHFVDKASAVKYYTPYIFAEKWWRSGDIAKKKATAAYDLVEEKMKKGEIKIGPPQCRHDETYFIKWSEGRYFKKVEN